MILSCENAELRGISKRSNQDGSAVYVANFEDIEGSPFQLFLGGSVGLLDGYKKGSRLTLTLDFIHSQKGNFLKLVGVGNCE